jgi:hypothetical protein
MEEEKLAFDPMCKAIVRLVRNAGGRAPFWRIGKKMQKSSRGKRDWREALEHLVDTHQLIEHRFRTDGRDACEYTLGKTEE